ncbi:MAG: hypothetical protein AAGA72_14800 [Pseudomonadota bacterium]
MPEYGDDAFYVWSVTIAGLLLPILMIAYSVIKVRLSKARLDRMKQEED